MDDGTCIACGGSCGPGSVRDAQDRRLCASCFDKGHKFAAPAAATAGSVGGSLELEPDDAPPARRDRMVLAPNDEPERAMCPVCVRRLAPEASVCLMCGFDPGIGLKSSRHVRKVDVEGTRRVICERCQHDLSNVTMMRCPECGKTVARMSHLDRLRRQSRQQTRREYLLPVVLAACGLTASLLIAGLVYGLPGLAAVGIAYPSMVVSTSIIFTLMAVLWFGMDAPLHLSLLRIGGIMAVVLAVFLAIPIPVLGVLIMLGCYLGLLYNLMDLDPSEAAYFVLASLFVPAAVGIVLGMML